MTKGARSSAVVALLVIVAGLAIAACGSSNSGSSASASAAGSTSTSTTGTSTTAGRGGGFANLTATQKSCLKSKGVTLPTGGGFRRGGPGTFTGPTGTPPGGGTSTSGGPAGGGFGGAGGPGGAAGGFAGGNSKFATAAKACGVTFGTGRFGARGGFGGRGGTAGVSSTALKKFVACVNTHGYKLTGVNTSGSGAALPKSLQTNKKFLAAAKSCTQYLRPTGGAPTGAAPGGAATTTTASAS